MEKQQLQVVIKRLEDALSSGDKIGNRAEIEKSLAEKKKELSKMGGGSSNPLTYKYDKIKSATKTGTPYSGSGGGSFSKLKSLLTESKVKQAYKKATR